MIEYLYSLDYQAEYHHPESEDVPPNEHPAINDSEGTDIFVKALPRQSGDTEQDNPDKMIGPVEDYTTIFDPLSFHILMYSLAERMFIWGLKVLSKTKVERELL